MADIRNIENAMMTGRERAKQMMERWQMQFMRPTFEMLAARLINTPEIRDELERMKPGSVAEARKRLEG